MVKAGVAAPFRQVEVFQQQAENIPDDVEYILFTEKQVKRRVRELGRDIARDYQGKDLLVICVLKGAFIFMADLTRAIAEEGLPGVKIDFLKAASYGTGSVSSGEVSIEMCGTTGTRWKGRHVLLVEDIIDTGNTLARLSAEIEHCGAASVGVATLLDKKGRRQVDFAADYAGFDCPNEFIVGYGLDYNETYRCLPYVAVLRPKAYGGHH